MCLFLAANANGQYLRIWPGEASERHGKTQLAKKVSIGGFRWLKKTSFPLTL